MSESLVWLEPKTPEQIMDELIESYEVDAVFCLFSGGQDSVCTSDYVAENYPDIYKGQVFTNTGLGTQKTRQFALEYSKERGWPLEMTWASERERFYNVVMNHGFAGRGNHRTWMGYLKHHTWYYYMKEQKKKWKHPAFISGVRKKESWARDKIKFYTKQPIDKDTGMLFCKPFLYKNGTQLQEYFIKNGLKKSPAYGWFDKSGECWCGAYSHNWELKMLQQYDPLTFDTIKWLERKIVEKRELLLKEYSVTESQLYNWIRIYKLGVFKDGLRLEEYQKQIVRLHVYDHWGSGPSTDDTLNQTTFEDFTVNEDYCGESCESG